MPRLTAALVALACLLTVACQTVQPTPTAASAANALDQARDALSQAESYTFEYRTETSERVVDAGSGRWISPDRYHATQLGAEVTVIGETMYSRTIGSSDGWQVRSLPEGQSPADSLAVPELESPAIVPLASGFEITGQAVAQLDKGSYTYPYSIVVSSGDYRPERAVSWENDPFSGGACTPPNQADSVPEGCLRTAIEYSGYGEAAPIEPPVVD